MIEPDETMRPFSVRRPPARRLLLALGAFLCATASLASPDNSAPALSPSCGVPMSKLAETAPLPHLAAALKNKKTIEIIAIGSSSTQGVGASRLDHTYPFQLQDILEKTFKGHDIYITNSGLGGELAAATAERIRTDVTAKHPDLVLWQVGTNDALAGVPVAEFRTTLRDTIRWLKEHGIDTALIGLQYCPTVEKSARHKLIERVIRKVAAAENVPVVRRYDAMEFLTNSKFEDLLSPDRLHQNDLGYRCMAEHVGRAVVVSAFPDAADALKTDQRTDQVGRQQP